MEQAPGFGLIFGTRPGEVLEAPGDIDVGPQARFIPDGGRRALGKEQAGDEGRSREAQVLSVAAPLNRVRRRKRTRPARRFRAWPRGRKEKTGSLR